MSSHRRSRDSLAAVRLADLAFAFDGGEPVFSALDAHFAAGWTGIVGPNGGGKTTLLRLVAGELSPTGGAVLVEPPGARVVLCAQRVDEPAPGVDALAAGVDAAGFELRGRLGLDPGDVARWPTLSPGERKRWQLGAALWSEPDVLLLDEPTNHLDAGGRDLVARALAGFAGVGLLVSHDRALLDALTTATLRVEGGGGRRWAGSYGEALVEQAAERSRLAAAREKASVVRSRLERRLGDLRRERGSAQRQRNTATRMRNAGDKDARGLLADTRAGWAEARLSRKVAVTRRRLEKSTGAVEDLRVERERGGSIFVDYERAPKDLLAVLDEAAVAAGDRVLLRDVRLTVRRDSRIWISGPNGSGKTTLLERVRAVLRLPPERCLWLPQELAPDREAALLAELRALDRAARGRVLAVVDALGVDPDRLLASRQPSPGEGRKLAVALALDRNAWLLALDEPTNHLDLPSIERLERALAAYPGALLLVTHDPELARACARERWQLGRGVVETSDVGAGG